MRENLKDVNNRGVREGVFEEREENWGLWEEWCENGEEGRRGVNVFYQGLMMYNPKRG